MVVPAFAGLKIRPDIGLVDPPRLGQITVYMIPINELDFIFLNGIAVVIAVDLCLYCIVFKALKMNPLAVISYG